MKSPAVAARQAILEARKAIDELDQRLVRLLNERTRHVVDVGRAKQLTGDPIYQPGREEKIFSSILGANQGPLDDGALRRLFERILDESRRAERLSTASKTEDTDTD